LIVQPDVLVVPMSEFQRLRREKRPVRELLIAAEMLSPSSGRFDRVTKRGPLPAPRRSLARPLPTEEQ
jgi:hypothetical protein